MRAMVLMLVAVELVAGCAGSPPREDDQVPATGAADVLSSAGCKIGIEVACHVRIVVDNGAGLIGSSIGDGEFESFNTPWEHRTDLPGYLGSDFLSAPWGMAMVGALWKPNLPKAGRYLVRAHLLPSPENARRAEYSLALGSESDEKLVIYKNVLVDQRTAPADGWAAIGTAYLWPGSHVELTVNRYAADPGGVVIADAVDLTLVD